MNVKDEQQQNGGRFKYKIPLLNFLKNNWDNWDRKGNSLASLVNRNRLSILCNNQPYQVVEEVEHQLTGDNRGGTGVYVSKILSQLFPDLCIPFDTDSSKRMKRNGYYPHNFGKGLLREHIIAFLQNNQLNAEFIRKSDNAPQRYWPNKRQFIQEIDVPTSYSRPIDKLFYNQQTKCT